MFTWVTPSRGNESGGNGPINGVDDNGSTNRCTRGCVGGTGDALSQLKSRHHFCLGSALLLLCAATVTELPTELFVAATIAQLAIL